MKQHSCDIVVIGSGIIGIATAYYLKKLAPDTSIVLLDSHQPMSLTSAHSGENYRNWWPHPVMTAFTNRSIDLMEELSVEDNNSINMTRRGYALTTRSNDIDTLLNELMSGYSGIENSDIRIHESVSSTSYQKPLKANWVDAPTGVDVIKDSRLIEQSFPSYDKRINTVVHIRRAGAISAQQMGQLMLQQYKLSGGARVQACVTAIDKQESFVVHDEISRTAIKATRLVNAAGPFINDIARMLGTTLPVSNTLQQKIAFEDTAKCIPRDMPFSIDLDPQTIDWDDEERRLLAASDEHNWLTSEMPGAIHCRPDGGDSGSWVKLGWAYNNDSAEVTREPLLQDAFPEIVLRGAARLNPGLKTYYGRLPRTMRHYGGYYTLTDENWPLIGRMSVKDAYVVGAMSGFGTMAACAAGDLCARIMTGAPSPHYADALSPQRYENQELMTSLRMSAQRGIL